MVIAASRLGRTVLESPVDGTLLLSLISHPPVRTGPPPARAPPVTRPTLVGFAFGVNSRHRFHTRANVTNSPAGRRAQASTSNWSAGLGPADRSPGGLDDLLYGVADPSPGAGQRLHLGLRRAPVAGDDGAGVAHPLSGRRGAPADEADHRLAESAGDHRLGRALLVASADLPDHHHGLGLRVGLEQ